MNAINQTRQLIKKYFPNEIYFLIVSLGMIISLFVFLQIAGAVNEGNTLSVDKKIFLLFRDSEDPSKTLGPERLQYIVRDITALGSSTLLTIITLFVVLYLALKKEIRSIVYVLTAAVGGGIFVQLLKHFFARQRPEFVTYLVSEVTMSFPSGHSAMSAVVYLSIAVLIARIEKSYMTRVFLISAALIISLLVGLSRIYLGAHYPTDVLAGWMIGLFWAIFCWFFTTIIENKK